MTRTTHQLITGKKSLWGVFDEKGICIKVFRLKLTAQMWIPYLKLNKREKLELREIT